MEHQSFKISEEKQKNIFIINISKTPVYYRNFIGQTHLGHKINFAVKTMYLKTKLRNRNEKWFLMILSILNHFFSFGIKRQMKYVFPKDFESTVDKW